MKLVLFPVLFASLTFGFSGFDYLDNFTCSVSGYTPKNFELQRQGEQLQVRASDISRKFRWVLQANDCDIENQNSLPGVFSCESSRPGTLELQGKSIEYERMTLRVSHQTRVIQVTHHQRVIDIMFEGGDLERPLTLQWAVTVNFYNLNPGITDAFNETCSMNGELIKK